MQDVWVRTPLAEGREAGVKALRWVRVGPSEVLGQTHSGTPSGAASQKTERPRVYKGQSRGLRAFCFLSASEEAWLPAFWFLQGSAVHLQASHLTFLCFHFLPHKNQLGDRN